MSAEGRPAEHALAARLGDLLEAAPDAMLVVDRGGTIVLSSSQAEALFGYAPAELVGRSVDDLVPERFRGAHAGHREAYASDARRRPMGAGLELFARRKDGGEFPAEISLSPVQLEDGTRVTIAAVRDVSARKASAALHEAQERLKYVVSSNPAVLFALRLGREPVGLTLSWISANVERLLGYTVDEAMAPDWWVGRLHPDDAGRVLSELAELPAQELVEQEYRFRDRTGGYRWMRAELRVLEDSGGQPSEVVGSWSDVSARKAAELRLVEREEQYRLLFESNPNPTFVVDVATLAFLAVNEAAVRHYGYSKEEFLDLTTEALRPAEEIPAMKRAIRAAEGDHAPSQSLGLLKHRKKDGTLIQVDVAASKIPFQGRPAWLVLATDVTERHSLEAQLAQAQRMEAVGQLAGGVAHDFNNLLGVITGYSDLLLKEQKAESPARRRLEQIAQAASRAAALTRQLLAFSRKQVLQPRVLDLNDVVSDIEKMLRRLIGEDIKLVSVFKPGLGRVRADPGQIEQVLMNLAVNARDAMPRGGRLTLETGGVALDEAYARQHADVAPGHYVVLSVSDTGHGIDADAMPHIFEPFFTTKEPGKGTGLGLATVFGIVKQSGGHVSVYSEPGHGTCFKIHLPRVEAEVERPAAPVLPPLPTGTETVLLVEDADALRVLVREVLENSGYTVVDAAAPEEALTKAQQHAGPIHAVLTDMVLPQMSGPEVATRLAIFRPEIRVLFMSGYTDTAVVAHGLLDPGHAFIQKPFTADALLRNLREVLKAPQGPRS